MKKIRLALLVLGAISTIALAYLVYNNESEKRMLKQDLIELSKVKYGIFNVDEWKKILADIIAKKVQEFNVSDVNRVEMSGKISSFLNVALTEFEVNYKRTNKSRSWFGISAKNLIANSVSIFPRLKENIPEFTEQILNYLNDPENKEKIKSYLVKKLNEYADDTFAELDYSTRNSILAKYNYQSHSEAMVGIQSKLDNLDKEHEAIYALLFVLILIQGICLVSFSHLKKIEFTLFILLSLVILLMGLLLPMIDIDARISEMSFKLLGEAIVFTDQVLYFKSKSILEVVYLMLSQGKIDLIAVGFLVLLFSVLFPIAKLVCSLLLLYSDKMRTNKLTRFIVFKTGKWSMADVMVIVIFMAYIGFSGILTEQLNQIQNISSGLDILTTNRSTLQFGFYMFLCFVLLSLFISERMSRSNYIQENGTS